MPDIIGSLIGGSTLGGNAIGSAIVRLRLDSDDYNRQLATAKTETTASTNAMGASTSRFAGVAKAALLGVGVAAVAGAALSVKAAIEANDAHIKLQNTFENNQRLSDSSVAAFERQADSLRDLTGVDDEAIIRGQALLGQFRLTGEQVLELTPLIVDLSEKMGIDLEAAAKAVGKATEGNTGALARYVGTIEKGRTPLETYTNITEKLGRVQGFAEESAKAEPWRVLGAQLEEVAEGIGQALLPLLQDLTKVLISLVPVVEGVAEAIRLTFSSETYTDIPIIGEIFKGLGDVIQHVGFALDQTTTESERTAMAIAQGGKVVGKTTEATTQWERALAEANEQTGITAARTNQLSKRFEDLKFDLDDVADSTKVSREEFTKYFTTLERNTRDLKQAAHDLRDERWLDPDFVAFLSEKGPQWIVRFADLNEEKQHRWQESWDDSNRRTNIANQNLDTILTTLNAFDKSESKHKVIIEYEYRGFDPSKPGMGRARGRAEAP